MITQEIINLYDNYIREQTERLTIDTLFEIANGKWNSYEEYINNMKELQEMENKKQDYDEIKHNLSSIHSFKVIPVIVSEAIFNYIKVKHGNGKR